MFDQLFGIMQEFEDGLGILTDAPKGSWWDAECEGLSCSIHPYTPTRGAYYATRTVYVVQRNQRWRRFFVYPNMWSETGCYLLDLLGVFVADENNNWINVNTVEPFDGVRCDVEQTVTALHPNKENGTSLQNVAYLEQTRR